jgi:hypothetical protein
MTDTNPSALSYWFPRLEAAGVPAPRTVIVQMSEAAQECMFAALDGKDGTDEQTAAFRAFCDEIRAAGHQLGWPCFLRTDHTSGKHEWRNTCHLPGPEAVEQHVFAIIEYSELRDIAGELPWRTWAVREMLPTMPLGTCPRYGDMPVCREFRYFVEDGVVACVHPYWPISALVEGGADQNLDCDALCQQPTDCDLKHLAEIAGRALPGAWSIDVLGTRRGWYVCDCAEADKSWHWPGCANIKRWRRER